MDNPIKNGIGEGTLANLFIPSLNIELRTENSRGNLVARFHNFQKVTRLIFPKGSKQPFIQNEQISFLIGLHYFLIDSLASSNSQFFQQIRKTDIFNGIKL